MKKIIFAACIAFFSSIASLSAENTSNEKGIPAIVNDSFSKHFPGIKAKWEKENLYYEANFTKDGKEMSAVFDSLGKLMETEIEIPISSLPPSITEYVSKNYKKKISEASKLTDSKGQITYEAEIGKIDLIFDANGNFLRESKS